MSILKKKRRSVACLNFFLCGNNKLFNFFIKVKNKNRKRNGNTIENQKIKKKSGNHEFTPLLGKRLYQVFCFEVLKFQFSKGKLLNKALMLIRCLWYS